MYVSDNRRMLARQKRAKIQRLWEKGVMTTDEAFDELRWISSWDVPGKHER